MSRCTCPPDHHHTCGHCQHRIDDVELFLEYGAVLEPALADAAAERYEQALCTALGAVVNRPNRSLAVLASLPRFCPVCRGSRSIPGVSVLGIPTSVRFECPHCVGVAGRPAEIRDPDWRTDIPREAS